jgi:two-component system, OmpR family, alkaline phosphatase synthesis response regulator PhoP
MSQIPSEGVSSLENATRPGTKILVVEDNPVFRKMVKALLEAEGYVVIATEDPNETTNLAKTHQPDLILMDVVLGDVSGIELCQRLKAQPYTSSLPVILLSGAQTDEEFQLQGFEEGADDYLLKPISNELLLAKVKAVLKRYSSPEELADILKAEGLALDVKSRKVVVLDQPVALTRKEFDLLTALLRKRGQVVYTTQLYHTVWGYGASAPVDSHTVKVHVSSLRSKLGPDLAKKIVNVPGLGYRFEN